MYLKEPDYNLSGLEEKLDVLRERITSLTFKLTEISSGEKNAFNNLPDYGKIVTKKEEKSWTI